jgi:hypothetical protein
MPSCTLGSFYSCVQSKGSDRSAHSWVALLTQCAQAMPEVTASRCAIYLAGVEEDRGPQSVVAIPGEIAFSRVSPHAQTGGVPAMDLPTNPVGRGPTPQREIALA